MAKSNERPGNDWFSKSELCRFQGIADQTFDKTYRGVVPPSAIKKTGIRVWYHGPTYFESVIAKRLADAKPANMLADDPLLAGGDSPNLEEYRKHKARIAKVEADEREGQAVQISVIEPVLLDALGNIRRSLVIVEREFGRNAVQPIVEAIDESIDAIQKHFADEKPRGNAALSDAGIPQAVPTPNDAGIRRG